MAEVEPQVRSVGQVRFALLAVGEAHLGAVEPEVAGEHLAQRRLRSQELASLAGHAQPLESLPFARLQPIGPRSHVVDPHVPDVEIPWL